MSQTFIKYKYIHTHINIYVLSLSRHSFLHIKISSGINSLQPEKISLILLIVNIWKKQIFSAVSYLKMLFYSHYLHFFGGSHFTYFAHSLPHLWQPQSFFCNYECSFFYKRDHTLFVFLCPTYLI